MVSISQKKVLKTVATGADPVDLQVLPGTRTAWVANVGSRNMIKIDLDRGEVVDTVALSAVPIRTPPATKPWGMREFTLQTPDGHRMTFGSLVG